MKKAFATKKSHSTTIDEEVDQALQSGFTLFFQTKTNYRDQLRNLKTV